MSVSLPAEPIHMHADPVRLAQLFSNLLNNACKFTPRGGRISLSAVREGTEVVVKVADTGIGISPEHLPRVFEMFSQAGPALERASNGLGIGLALVRGLAEMHDGSVMALSAGVGRGSEFVVRLPILTEIPPAVASGSDTPAAQRCGARRILIVEDQQDAAQSLAMLLRMEGSDVRLAHDGPDALEKASEYAPDVILLDIGLPGLNGYEVCRAIRRQPWGRNVPVIALTGWGQDEDRRKANEAGFDGHLVKPVDPAEMMSLLASMVPV